MILVVALNPALDVTHHVAGADWAGVNRPAAVHARAGGKGLNVARTLRALGQTVTLTGLAGGRTGEALADGLAGTGIAAELTPIAGETRRTFVVADSVNGQTALFNEPGPAVSAAEYEQFFVSYEKALASSAAVVLSGSLPPGVPADAYAGLITAATAAGVPAILDASGTALARGAAAGPAVVKPNLAELEAATGHEVSSADRRDLPAVERAAARPGRARHERRGLARDRTGCSRWARTAPGTPGRPGTFQGTRPAPATRSWPDSPTPWSAARTGRPRCGMLSRSAPRRPPRPSRASSAGPTTSGS